MWFILGLRLKLRIKIRIKTKKIQGALEFNQWQWVKPYVELNTQKRIEAEKNRGKDGKAF